MNRQMITVTTSTGNLTLFRDASGYRFHREGTDADERTFKSAQEAAKGAAASDEEARQIAQGEWEDMA